MKVELELEDNFVEQAQAALASSERTDVDEVLGEVVRVIEGAHALGAYERANAEINDLWDRWEDLRPDVEHFSTSVALSQQVMERAMKLSRDMNRLMDSHADVRLQTINAWMRLHLLPAKVDA